MRFAMPPASFAAMKTKPKTKAFTVRVHVAELAELRRLKRQQDGPQKVKLTVHGLRRGALTVHEEVQDIFDYGLEELLEMRRSEAGE